MDAMDTHVHIDIYVYKKVKQYGYMLKFLN